MSRPNRKKNNKKKKKRTGEAGTPTTSDTSSLGAQVSGERGATRENTTSHPLSSDNVASASTKPMEREPPKNEPVAAAQGEPKPPPQKEPETLPEKEKKASGTTDATKETMSLEIPSGNRQSGGQPVQSSVIKKATIETEAPTATAASLSTMAPGDANKETTSQTCVCTLQ